MEHYDLSEPNVICAEPKIVNIIKRSLKKLFGKHQFAATLTTLNILRYLRKIDPSVVHIHNIHHLTLNYAMLYRYLVKNRIGLAVTLHDMWPITGGCYHFSDIGCDGYLRECINCPKPPELLDCLPGATASNYRFKKRCYENLRVKFVAVSDWVYGELQKTYLKDFDVTVIKNPLNGVYGIKNKRDYFSSNSDLNRKKILLGVSNYWTDDKGLEDFYKLSDMLENQCCIVLIGTPPLKPVKKPNLIFWGKLKSTEELCAAYNSADVFVHLSRAETFGMVIAEAAACGTVPIGYDTTGISEVVKLCGGVSVAPNNIEGVCSAVRNICIENTRITSEQSDAIKHLFSAETMNKKYLEVYNDLFSGIDE